MMSSSTSFHNKLEYDHSNDGSGNAVAIGNSENRVLFASESRYAPHASPQYPSNGVDERNSFIYPSNSVPSWHLNYNSNQSQDHQNQITEQPRIGSWMPPASLSQNCPWMSPTTPQPNSNLNSQMNFNSTYHDRSYRTGNTNSTQSLQPCGRMSHLFNAVEFAVNRPSNHQEQTNPPLGRDGMLIGPRSSSYKGYQRHNHYVFQAFNHQRHQNYLDVSMRGQTPYCCPNCKRVYNWKYNLTRHMRYECGTESRFQCAHCKRCFPHKQNAIHHNIRKHRIHYEKNHLYVDNGDVIIKTIV